MGNRPAVMDPHWHGTQNGYSNYGCRCDSCKKAHAEEKAESRAARYAGRVLIEGKLVCVREGVVHGKYTTYFNWGCNCTPCVDARNKYERERRRRNKEKRETKQRENLRVGVL